MKGITTILLTLCLTACASAPARERYAATPKPEQKIFVRSIASAEEQCDAYVAALRRNGRDAGATLIGQGVGGLVGAAAGLATTAVLVTGQAVAAQPVPGDQDYRDCMDRYGYTTEPRR